MAPITGNFTNWPYYLFRLDKLSPRLYLISSSVFLYLPLRSLFLPPFLVSLSSATPNPSPKSVAWSCPQRSKLGSTDSAFMTNWGNCVCYRHLGAGRKGSHRWLLLDWIVGKLLRFTRPWSLWQFLHGPRHRVSWTEELCSKEALLTTLCSF